MPGRQYWPGVPRSARGWVHGEGSPPTTWGSTTLGPWLTGAGFQSPLVGGLLLHVHGGHVVEAGRLGHLGVDPVVLLKLGRSPGSRLGSLESLD